MGFHVPMWAGQMEKWTWPTQHIEAKLLTPYGPHFSTHFLERNLRNFFFTDVLLLRVQLIMSQHLFGCWPDAKKYMDNWHSSLAHIHLWNAHLVTLNRCHSCISKKTSKLRVTGLYEGNSPVTGEFHAQRASNAENVSIWWRYHVYD